MKKMIAVVLMLVAWASLAHGQTVVQDGQKSYTMQGSYIAGVKRGDTTGVVINGTSTGALSVADESRDRDYITLFSSAIANDSLDVGAADSSAVLSVGAYRYLKILIKAGPISRPGLSANTTIRLAFQFRECANAATDSNSVFAEYNYATTNQGVTANAADSSMAGHLTTGSATAQWSGEYGILIAGNRAAPASGVAATVFSYPNGISIPLDSVFGRPARFNKLQIRVRNMNNSNPKVRVTVHVLGFAQ